MPWRQNVGAEYTYFDPTAKEGFWRSQLWISENLEGQKSDLSEIEQRKGPKERYDTMKTTIQCNALAPTAEECGAEPLCLLFNRASSNSSSSTSVGEVSYVMECVDTAFPHLVDKAFVFDFVPCEPPSACLGNNECGKGYEGVFHMCNGWYSDNKIGDNEISIRTCKTDFDCGTKSGASGVQSKCSVDRPQDCSVCDFSDPQIGTKAGEFVGQCRCTGSPRCGQCTRGVALSNGTQIEGFHRINGECAACPTNVIVIIVLFVLAIVMGMFGASWLEHKKINMAFIPIGVDYFQVLAIFTGSNIPWPSYISELFALFSFFNINIDIAAPECLDPNLTYALKFSLTMAAPFVVLGLMFLLFAFKFIKAKFCQSCCNQEKFDARWYISIFLIIVSF